MERTVGAHCFVLPDLRHPVHGPLLFSFHPRLRFDRAWFAFWPVIGGMMLLFIPWDIWFTHRGIWGFNTAHLSGLALWLLLLQVWMKPTWTGREYFAFLVLQLPFLVVNGILTGSFLDAPVVRYNDMQNLCVRIGTIPVEDFFTRIVDVLGDRDGS